MAKTVCLFINHDLSTFTRIMHSLPPMYIFALEPLMWRNFAYFAAKEEEVIKSIELPTITFKRIDFNVYKECE